jgi:hypothetical protein
MAEVVFDSVEFNLKLPGDSVCRIAPRLAAAMIRVTKQDLAGVRPMPAG